MMRIGTGYDVHRLSGGRKLVIGGVDIPSEQGLVGHSDADVLLHAICDALLGAAGLGDIGRHFPDSAPKYKGISSLHLLGEVRRLITEAGYRINNIDATIVAEHPKMSPHVPEMVANIAEAAGIDRAAVNVKATTTEGLGFAGKGEGMAAYAVCTIWKGE
jgi:2-C-methyl-D-erythritol 2,4-cyclodiphosphate synthase